ncbi:hypothetical protein SAMN03159444_01400 [Pseudomonas sp. NFACC02]|uniref:hypothetical protein n=1 Tax=Pseudomonas sp. NFACC02 TaxID=1566250 RepID=UPI0008CA232C|nr:hypothetical protein [Pseudomonas sp. NFACC02]SEQ27825.1 hypothetical protein SAMN03159444_01400 [Pseudomonas sp. NFACC02]
MSVHPDLKPGLRLAALLVITVGAAGFGVGYSYPRDVELESMAPIAFHYEITSDAAKYLLLRDGPKCEVKP